MTCGKPVCDARNLRHSGNALVLPSVNTRASPGVSLKCHKALQRIGRAPGREEAPYDFYRKGLSVARTMLAKQECSVDDAA